MEVQVPRINYEDVRALYHLARAREWNRMGVPASVKMHVELAAQWAQLANEWRAVLLSRRIRNGGK